MKLKQYLDENNVKQKDFARKIEDLSGGKASPDSSAVSLWANGNRVPTIMHAFLIRRASGGAVDFRDWMDEGEHPWFFEGEF